MTHVTQAGPSFAVLSCLLAPFLLLCSHQGCYLTPKHTGARSLVVQPGSSLLTTEGQSKPSPHLGLGITPHCGAESHLSWQKTSC